MKTGLKRLLVEREARNTKRGREIIERAERLGIEVLSPDEIEQNSRQSLVLNAVSSSHVNKWEHHPPLPDRAENCISPVEGCPFDCCYCYLLTYLQESVPRATVNYELIYQEIEQRIKTGEKYFSLGELSDGLELEPVMHFLPFIWNLFQKNEQVRLEIRSKSINVGPVLRELMPLKNVTFAWTLSPPSVARRIELRTAAPKERIKALKRLAEAGFNCALRLDPIILQRDWEEEYRQLVEHIFAEINPKQLQYIILGCFRFPAGLDQTIEKRFPGRDFIRDEFVRGPDGKYRYPRFRRTAAYRKFLNWLPVENLRVGLCMEPEYIWNDLVIKK